MFARLSAVGLSFAVASVAFGGTIRVPADAQTIQIAISDALPFDTIIVDPGTYFEAISFGGKVITVQSTNPNDPAVVAATIIDAGGLGVVVTFSGSEDENTVLDGLTITGGTTGITGNRSLATIKRCVIRGNSLAGVFRVDGRIEDCQIRGNESRGVVDCDGAIRRCLIRNNKGDGAQSCDGTIVDTVIENSRSGSGVSTGTADISRCTIRNNDGFGVTNHSVGRISQSSISGNAGVGISGGNTGIVENCVIAGNNGAGVRSSRKTLLSCTITGNLGFGISAHTGTISHVVLWDNLSGAISNSTTPLFSGTANPFFVQPGFFDLGNVWVNGDYHLTPSSPFIDAGDPRYLDDPSVPLEDMDGNPRVVGARIDVGALEFQSECAGDDFDGDGTPDVCDRDIDDDGIPNVPDRCDFTPLGIPVNAEGRPLMDANLDCVVDLRDYAEFQRSMFGPIP